MQVVTHAAEDGPLTTQQEKFAQGVAAGKSQSAAYREAYPKSLAWENKSVWVNASELRANAKVSRRIKQLQEEQREKSSVTLDGLTQNLKDVYEQALEEGDNAAAVAAVRQISKMHGLDTEKRANDRSPVDGLTVQERALLRGKVADAIELAIIDAASEPEPSSQS